MRVRPGSRWAAVRWGLNSLIWTAGSFSALQPMVFLSISFDHTNDTILPYSFQHSKRENDADVELKSSLNINA